MLLDEVSKLLSEPECSLPNICKISSPHSKPKTESNSKFMDFLAKKKAIEKYNHNPIQIPNFFDKERMKSVEVFVKTNHYRNNIRNLHQNRKIHQHEEIKKNDHEISVKNIIKKSNSRLNILTNNRNGKIFSTELWPKQVYTDMLKSPLIKNDFNKLLNQNRFDYENKLTKLQEVFQKRHKKENFHEVPNFRVPTANTHITTSAILDYDIEKENYKIYSKTLPNIDDKIELIVEEKEVQTKKTKYDLLIKNIHSGS